MKFAPHQIAAAVLVAGLSLAATAQTPPPPPPPPGAPMQIQRAPGGPEMRMHERMHERGDRRHDRMARRMDQLKEALRITPAQEPAWGAFTSAMRPGQRQRPDIGEMARLTTPERIDRMRQLRAQRMADQDRRGEATKTFYAQLSGDQKRVFDQLTLRMHGGKGRGGRHGHHGGGYRG